jgi:hypothetical protein
MDAKLFNYIEERAQNIRNYSDKLTESLREIDGIVTEVIKKVKMSCRDEMPLKIESSDYGTTRYYLKVVYSKNDPSGLAIVKRSEYGPDSDDWIFEASKELQRIAVTRLPVFMEVYAKKLEEKETDCKECAELAENILNAISPKPKIKVRRYRYGSIRKD